MLHYKIYFFKTFYAKKQNSNRSKVAQFFVFLEKTDLKTKKVIFY